MIPNIVLGQGSYSIYNAAITDAVRQIVEDRYYNMRQDLNGKELSIGDKILVCIEKEYGWLGYATIVGETNLSWKIELDDTTWYNNKRNFEKNPKRILKV